MREIVETMLYLAPLAVIGGFIGSFGAAGVGVSVLYILGVWTVLIITGAA